MRPLTVIKGPRRSGRTTELIGMSAARRFYIVTLTHQRARFIAEQASLRGLDIPFPMTYEEWASGHFNARGCKGFLFDDLDEWLRSKSKLAEVGAVVIAEPEYTRLIPPP